MIRKIGMLLGFISSAILIIIGIMKNQPNSVMIKAIKICLECVGIG